MSRRPTSAPTVELFPFLAVLVCTMGALILLLLAMTQKIRLQAIGKALASVQVVRVKPTDAAPAHDPVAPELSAAEREELRRRREAEWQRQLAEFAARRDRQQATVAEKQRDLTEADRKLRDSQQRLQKAQLRLAAIETEQVELTDEEKKLLTEQEQAGERVALTQRRLERLKQQQAAAPTKYSLVPYDGASGTTRRPLYVECTGKGLRILPEDEFLGPEELDGFTSNYNPLLAGLRAVSEYWTTTGALKTGKGGSVEVDRREPYVLLLVRPSGSISYYVARKMIAGLRIPFGYELIEEDWQLDLPQPDPDAKRLAHAAIIGTMAARADLLKSVASATGGRSASGEGGLTARGLVPTGDGQTVRPRIDVKSPAPGQPVAPGIVPPVMPTPAGVGVRRGVGPQGEAVTLSDEFADEIGRMRRQGIGSPAEPPGTVPGYSAPGTFVQPRQAKSIGTPGALVGEASRSSTGDVGPTGTNAGPRAPQDGTGSDGTGRLRGTPAGQHSGAQAATSAPSADQPQVASNAGQLPEDGREWRTNRSPGAELSDEPAGLNSDNEPPAKRNSGKRDVQLKKNWGQRVSRGGIGLEKKFEVVVLADRLLVGNADLVIPAGRGETRDELADEMSQAISILERTWGRPPANFYWIPAVHFVVHPGGNQHYERLHPKLREWGIYSTVEFQLGPKGK